MKGVLSDDPGDRLGGEWEPTHGAGPCLWEAGILDAESSAWVAAVVESRGYPGLDVLVHEAGDVEVYVRIFSGPECPELAELRARFCEGAEAGKAFQAVDWPEVSRAVVEGGCLEIVVPADPLFRVKEALRKLGLTPPLKARAYRPVERIDE